MEERSVPTTSLYHDDETAWLERTAELLAQRRFEEVDCDQLSEYLSDLARRDKREVLSRLPLLIAHLLKWEHQPGQRGNSWQATIAVQRQELADLLESKTLHNFAVENLEKVYQRGVKQAAAETGRGEGDFPGACPWTVEEIMGEV